MVNFLFTLLIRFHVVIWGQTSSCWIMSPLPLNTQVDDLTPVGAQQVVILRKAEASGNLCSLRWVFVNGLAVGGTPGT